MKSSCHSYRLWLIVALVLVSGLLIFRPAPSTIVAYLPILIILICPLSMLFMMKHMSHGSCHDKKHDSDEKKSPESK